MSTNPDNFRALDYFARLPGDERFWKWGPQLECLLWVDDSPVLWRRELIPMLRALEATGLPRLGCLVLLAASCRGKTIYVCWDEPTEDERQNHRLPCTILSAHYHTRESQRLALLATPEFITDALERLADLPFELEGLLDTPGVLTELAVLLLSSAPKPTRFEGIVGCFAEGSLSEQDVSSPKRCAAKYTRVLVDAVELGRGLAKHPPGALRRELEAALAAQAARESCGFTRLRANGHDGSSCPLTNVRRFMLPLGRRWQQAVPCSWGCAAASLMPEDEFSRLVVTRCTWDGVTQIARWPEADPFRPVVLASAGANRLLVHQPGAPLLSDQLLPALTGAFETSIAVGCGGWLPAGTIHVVSDGGHVRVLQRRPAHAKLHWRHEGSPGFFDFDTHPPRRLCGDLSETWPPQDEGLRYEELTVPERVTTSLHDPDGTLVAREDVESLQPLLSHPNEGPPPMAIAGLRTALGIGNRMVILNDGTCYSFEHTVRRLVVGASEGRIGVAIGFDRGVSAHWIGAEHVFPIDEKIENPRMVFLEDGRLLVLGDTLGLLVSFDRHGAREVERFAWPGNAPVALLATGTVGEVATLAATGLMEVWTTVR